MKYLITTSILFLSTLLQAQHLENALWETCTDSTNSILILEGGVSIQLDTAQNRIYLRGKDFVLPLYIVSSSPYYQKYFGGQVVNNVEYQTITGNLVSITWIDDKLSSLIYFGGTRTESGNSCLMIKAWR